MLQDQYDTNADGIVDVAGGIQILATAGIGGVVAYQVVMMWTDGTVIPADGENATHAGLTFGMATETIAEDAEGSIQIGGEIENLSWNLDPGEIYYLAIGGTISKTPPATGFWQKVGVAKDSVTLIISLGEPILIL